MLGILGGMSWESTVSYYQEINRAYHRARGRLHSAPVLVNSLDFQPIEQLQRSDEWSAAAEILTAGARALRAGGAEILLLATNTMHIVYEQLSSAAGGEWIHIADPTGAACQTAGHRRVGLLGTRFTMERDFYRRRLEERYALEVLTPARDDRALVDGVIFDELVRGRLLDESRNRFRAVIAALAAEGAEAVILGCPEIGLLLRQADSPLPLLDTTVLHAGAAVDRLLTREGIGSPHEA